MRAAVALSRRRHYHSPVDHLFELMRRDAMDSLRFLRWLGHVLRLPLMARCRTCNDNPWRSCAACYEEGWPLS